jgi:hypothetical protein
MAIGLAFLSKINKNFIYLGALIFLVNIVVNYGDNYHSEDFLVNEYTKNMLNSLDSNAIVFSAQWDFFVAPFQYLQTVEGVRPDIVLVEKELLRRTWYPLQFKHWYPEVYSTSRSSFQDFNNILERFETGQPYSPEEIQAKYENIFKSIIEKNINKRPIYITLDVLQSENTLFENYKVIPYGFALRVVQRDTVINFDYNKLDLDYFLQVKGLFKGILPENLEMLIGDNLFNMALYNYQTGQNEKSKEILKIALIMNPNHQMAQRLRHTLQL